MMIYFKRHYLSQGQGLGGVTYETYTYDGLGRLVTSTDSASKAISFTYDLLGNLLSETNGGKTTVFTLIERPETYRGNISGYIYDDTNQNGVRDPGEKGMAGWKICIDTSNNGTCEENTEVFNLSNNDGYYEFDSLITGTYSIQEIPHQNWVITQPTTSRRIINLLNGQRLQNQNFGNFKTKGTKK